ncbi:hypothetical protein [Pseudoxanthomonas sp. PXM02]|uniref:hypothetical protein n=1 Tax=Pseudoxanthomonas sp. PXM02 TaxID=2769294 RepID=UPI001784BA16|nr:hypothetical protein [Pseudoxanthomonas sp. PXM02]MBD9477455.1 hypothetical protein [Pseudoxanthomonas sp. PXM02]
MSSSSASACAWRVLLACGLIVAGTSTWASDPIHKCRDRDGRSQYQATSCNAVQTTEWVREFPQDPSPPATSTTPEPAAAARSEGTRQRSRSGPRRRASSAQGAVISMHRDAVACERAKKARDQAYARLGLKRDFATSRKLDDRVNEACR